MRSPEHRKLAQPRAGRQFEDEFQLRYLSPGAFTVLPPDDRQSQNPPPAPEPYRLTPGTRRHKNQAFAIIGEVDGTLSPPTGRTSPFRGRGFNPIGSRHVSPTTSPSPPPEDVRYTPTTLSPRHSSKIPQLKRRGSSHFGEKVSHDEMSPTKRKITSKFSQSMTNLQDAKTGRKPPPSPRRTAYSKAPAFEKLSPILGSSPEPSQSVSSPSRIPRSRSTPPSRKPSPNRKESSKTDKPPPSNTNNISRNTSRNQSRIQSRNPSRSSSRETSPTKTPKTPKTPISPSKIPVQKYKHVQAKVNSHTKPKVPPKSQVLSELSTDSESSKNITYKKPLNRKDSVNRLRITSSSNLLPKTNNSSKVTNNEFSSSNSKPSVSSTSNKSNNNANVTKNNNKVNNVGDTKVFLKGNPVNSTKPNKENDAGKENKKNTNDGKDSNTSSSNSNAISNIKNINNAKEEQTKVENNSDVLPSTTAVVSSTTSTVTQPLKIETTLNPPKQIVSKPVSPMIDGRVLSATSVSNAINKMNDTVLDTKTVIRDHGLNKFGNAPNLITSATSESIKNSNTSNPLGPKGSPEFSSKGTTEENSKKLTHNNHTNHVGLGIRSKDLEMEVQRNLNKLINPDMVTTNSTHQTINDSIKQARPDLPSDVKPIRITVREKPSDVEVQSGNVRLPTSFSNGVSDRPGPGIYGGTAVAGRAAIAVAGFVQRLIKDTADGLISRLPPGQQTPPNEREKEKETPPQNACSKFLVNCKRKLACQCCRKETSVEEAKEQEESTPGCLSCLKKQKKNQPLQQTPARISFEDETVKSSKWFDRLKCCSTRKVTDSTTCLPLGKRKESWPERKNSILSSIPTAPKTETCSKICCRNFWRKIFCQNCSCCRKKKSLEEEPARKQSIASKKKSLTPTTLPPPEDTSPKIDISLVEHTSHMRGAIPILPICLAWFCLVMNCIAPGTGTFLSGLFCLCLGIPRFSQKDGPKPRIGAFLINIIIGFSQFFTVLFCLVGWGWSIWWGVIMLKISRKHKKFKHLEKIEQATFQPGANPTRTRDVVRHT